MTGITLAQAQAKLNLWMEADNAVASGQSYSINGRGLNRANANEIRENIKYWDKWCKRLDRGGMRVRRVVPL